MSSYNPSNPNGYRSAAGYQTMNTHSNQYRSSEVPQPSQQRPYPGIGQPAVYGNVRSQNGQQPPYVPQNQQPSHVQSRPTQQIGRQPVQRLPPTAQNEYGMQTPPSGQARRPQPMSMNRAPSSQSQTTSESSPKSQSSEEGKEKTWTCYHPGCFDGGQLKMFARKDDLARHLKTHMGADRQRFPCLVPGCKRGGNNGLPRQDKLTDHMREVHKMDRYMYA